VSLGPLEQLTLVAETRVERRLAAILAADVVGFSRLMGQDEAGTLATLKRRRKDVLEPLVAHHQGRVFKVMGDGALVEFRSAVNAVQCAVDLQDAMAKANAGLPEGRHIVLRIGINLGDVMVEGSELYGDGINVAARLEQLAEPGGVLVSSTVFEHIRNKVNTAFADLGAQTLKNIAEPVRVYRIAGTMRVTEGTKRVVAERPAVAVLPLTNMSSDPEQQYFSDGITEDIITELSRFRSLFVIARNSAFQFRGAADVKQIARQLGVHYVVEGSVRRFGDRIRVTTQLIEADTGNHLWAQHYDRDIRDVFSVQDEIVHAIAATIEGRVAASGAQRSRSKPTSDLAAYDCFLQGREIIERRGDAEAAAQLFRRALKLDHNFAQAYAWLGRIDIHRFHFELQPARLDEAVKLAEQALFLDEADAWSHAVLAHAYVIGGHHDLAGLHLDRAMSLNSTDIRITSQRANWLSYTGRGDEAVQSLDADLQRDPFPPAWFWDYRGIALFEARQYEEAIRALSHLTTIYHWDYYYLVAAFAHLGRMERARSCSAEILRARPNFSLRDVGMTEPFKDPADLEHLVGGLRKAGLPE
jgi:adenylate cyclase